MPTIKDIAQKAGVSVATVSYVLNNNRFVSADKRERILDAIKELNYVPNAVARGLRVRESKAISLIVSDITNPFYPDLAKACEDVAQSLGYTVNMINTNDVSSRVELAASQLLEGKIDGLILTVALERDRPVIERLLEGDYPVVLAHRGLDHLKADIVVSDNFDGAVQATNHLIRLGHKRISLMTGVEGSSVTAARLNGYLHSMKLAGLAVMPEWLPSGGARYAKSYEATKTLLQLPANQRPTAVINISDIGALGVIDAAMDSGLRIPDDLGVVGFDDLFISAIRRVQLTTVKIPRYELGQRATELLLQRIGRTRDEPREIVLPVELIVRQTCGAAN